VNQRASMQFNDVTWYKALLQSYCPSCRKFGIRTV